MTADAADPYLLFGMRTMFADSFRRAVGCDSPSCGNCPRILACPYQEVFAQAISTDPAAVKRFQKPPLPFVFDVPILPPPPNSGRTVEIGLTLAGRATHHAKLFLDAVVILFRHWHVHGKVAATVVKVESVDHAGNRSVVADQGGEIALGRLSLLSLVGLQQSAVLSPDTIDLSLTTPLCLLKDGRPQREFSFTALVRTLLRRMSAISYYYGGIDLELDYKWLSSQSMEIAAGENDFRWVEWNRSLYGIVGRGTFAGVLTDFHHVLLFGEYFHAGKGAAYGLGCYRLAKAR